MYQHVNEEPDRWPLTRPGTSAEWDHVMKVMVVRRVPKYGPIDRIELMHLVDEDIKTASARGLIYVDSDFIALSHPSSVINKMCSRDKTLRAIGTVKENGLISSVIYRTEITDRWIGLVPVAVQAIVNFLPTTNLLDMMVQSLNDDEIDKSSDVRSE